ncbi:ubiquitin-protein ligase E3C-like [Macrosteles quadrilineatus]|uniref:ubiquitin-protein ligase E3C-like n=1 Tax=Macrosteles quadrilineatus TaxID=74068 RepID=UPI0023E268B8|nr:ubiquitin-protein ligase E3C-like [Macrosteles quadrilineatus]
MYSFEGQFRRIPEQNLAGASIKEHRDELLNRAHFERSQREECRRREKSSVCIQAHLRSFAVRQAQKQLERNEFDAIVKKCELSDPNDATLTLLVQKILFFYNPDVDANRLVIVCRMVLKQCKRLLTSCIEDSLWQFRVRKLLSISMSRFGPTFDREVMATPLRLFEIITSQQTLQKDVGLSEERAVAFLVQMFKFLIRKGYLAHMRFLLEATCPPLLDVTPTPPTPLAQCIYDLITRPMYLVHQTTDYEYRHLVMEHVAKDLFCSQPSEPISHFLLPALNNDTRFPLTVFIQTLNSGHLPMSSWLLHSYLSLDKQLSFNTSKELLDYLQVLAELTKNFNRMLAPPSRDDDDDDMSDTEEDNVNTSEKIEIQVLEKCIEMISGEERVQRLLTAVDKMIQPAVLQALCQVCHNLLILRKLNNHKHSRLLYLLALKPQFLQQLWTAILGANQTSLFGSPTPLLTVIARGIPMSEQETERIVPLLATFCSLFSLLVASLHDAEFYSDDDIMLRGTTTMPFSLPTLVGMTARLKEVSLGLVELAFPDSRPSVKDQYRSAVCADDNTYANTVMWSHLFKACVKLMRQLYSRDLRRTFCPEGHWISQSVTQSLAMDRPSDATLRNRSRLRHHYIPFHDIVAFTREELEEGPPPSTKEVRILTILKEIPFVVAFQERVLVFQSLVLKDKISYQSMARNFLHGPSINIMVRRNYLYEDAFDKLSPENEPELRLVMRVQLVSAVGLDEAGVDGGGVFREFLSELLKTAFDPNRGFFRLTKDNLLYPNPHVHLLHPNFLKHYYFIGRMLGKALYENLLVELPLAEFFMSKVVGRHADVDMHHLVSLDPILYHNLLYLKNYEGDVQDLGLDFTVVHDELGETKVDELKPGGNNIPVTSANRIEYIHLVADNKLNKQIKMQCSAFKQGLADVIPLEWLQMFSNKEFQVLISGAEIPVDVHDLQLHTNYTGGYTAEHPTIKMFWTAVSDFDDIQRRQLLKFVTSCSRPPLLGFKELDPPFCIQHAGVADRLPTASTCMNLLKLPEFKSETLLRDKLLYAIQSGSGFELS